MEPPALMSQGKTVSAVVALGELEDDSLELVNESTSTTELYLRLNYPDTSS